MSKQQTAYPVNFPVALEAFKLQMANRTKTFGRNRVFNGRSGARVALLLTFLGAIGTVAVGISGMRLPYTIFSLDSERAWNLVALFATASTTAIQAWAAYAGHRLAYAFYADGETRLWQLRRDLEHVELMPQGDARNVALAALYSQFQQLLVDLNTRWQAQQQEEAK